MIYPWGDTRRYNSYARFFRERFGNRVQKVTVNAGFTCPNRDGAIGRGGCTFCRNDAFTPSYCMQGGSIAWQISEGIRFHANRYRNADRFLVYFQSFSNTYAPLERLRAIYEEALAVPAVAGLVIGTRPDCVDGPKLDYLAELSERHFIAVEYGVESCYDHTLAAINRGHDFAAARAAIDQSAARGLHTGAHFILGLPGETDRMLLEQTALINSLPLTTVKFHQLQLFADTLMEKQYREDPAAFRFWTLDQYLDLFTGILVRLRPDIVIERFAGEAPPRFHAGPTWGLIRNDQLWTMLEKRLEANDLWQGMDWS